jgi:hypothetical protein
MSESTLRIVSGVVCLVLIVILIQRRRHRMR